MNAIGHYHHHHHHRHPSGLDVTVLVLSYVTCLLRLSFQPASYPWYIYITPSSTEPILFIITTVTSCYHLLPFIFSSRILSAVLTNTRHIMHWKSNHTPIICSHHSIVNFTFVPYLSIQYPTHLTHTAMSSTLPLPYHPSQPS